MQKLSFRTLDTEEEIIGYLSKVQSHTGVKLPFSYGKRSRIVGVFSQNRMVAGYMLVTKPDFRSLMFVPDQIKNSHEFFTKDNYEMMEVNGLWIGPRVKSPKAQFAIWLRLVFDIFRCRKKYLLLMCNRRNRTIQKIHSLTKPVTLYEGPPQLNTDTTTHNEVKVSYTTRWRTIINIPRYITELRAREHRVAQSAKGHLSLES